MWTVLVLTSESLLCSQLASIISYATWRGHLYAKVWLFNYHWMWEEALMPFHHVVIVGSYRESPLTKLIEAGWPCWKAFATWCSCWHWRVAPFRAAGLIQPGKTPKLAADRQHKHTVKTTLLRGKQRRLVKQLFLLGRLFILWFLRAINRKWEEFT